MARNYLAVFLLPVPQREHAEIINVIRDISKGDYKSAFVGAKAVGYLFSSDLLPWDISFSKIVMNDDSVLIVELGQKFAQQNLRVAENWLKSHLDGGN